MWPGQEVARVIPVVDSRYIQIQEKAEEEDSVQDGSDTSPQVCLLSKMSLVHFETILLSVWWVFQSSKIM